MPIFDSDNNMNKMENIIEQIFTTEHDDTNLECLCDVLFSHYPDGVIVKVLEINGIDSTSFKKEYLIDVANKIHEQVVNEAFEKEQSKKEYYDEGNR